MDNYRREFLGVFVATLFTGVILLASIQSHGATGISTIVYPTGVFPTDVQNVQAAVDLGGTVLLKSVNATGDTAAFNFGTPRCFPDRFVSLSTDVNIVGERVGPHMTT